MSDNNETKTILTTAQKANSFTSKVGVCAIGLVIGLLLGIGGSIFFSNYNPPDAKKGAETVTASVVFERVKAQNELVAASQKYNITKKAGDSNVIPFTDIPIPFTDNSFWYRYVGEIKVGVDLKTAEFKQDGNVISVTLDQPKIISNTPDMTESAVLEENNNIFNPINVEDVKSFEASCIEESEKYALEGDIMDEAKANAEQNLNAMFSAALGDGYKVEITWR